MLKRIKQYIESENLLDKNKMHLVALSGGADSVCLLLTLKRLGYKLHATHCNFRLRGEESNRDESFCEELCKQEEIPFHRVHFDTKAYASLHHVSIEMAARELRYNYFEQLRKAIDAADILVAHHKDDSVETFLMNVMKGTGIHGTQGIRPRNGHIVRPLLCIRRHEIENWLEEIKQPYITDSSNLENDVIRNKIRLDLIPAMKAIFPTVIDNLSNTIKRLNESVKVFDFQIEKSVKEVTHDVSSIHGGIYIEIDLFALRSQPSPEYTLFTILTRYGFTPLQIENIAKALDNTVGKRWFSQDYQLVSDRNKLILTDNIDLHNDTFRIPEYGTYIIKESVNSVGNETSHQDSIISVTEKLSINKIEIDDRFCISKESDCINLDADKLKFPLIMRRIKDGDRFIPFGMKGNKLVSDFLTDRKRSIIEKESAWVLTDADSNIVWLVNERPDNRYCVTPETINCAEIRYTKEIK